MTTPLPVNPFGVVGSSVPRIYTPPLVELTPETSYGFAVCDFAASINRPLDPWQRWAVIHAGELLPDGRPRFRKVILLVARQNGKTELLVVLTLFWMWVDQVPLVLGTSTKLDYAAESWKKATALVRKDPVLSAELPKAGVRKANGEQELWRATFEEELVGEGSRYKIAASNAEGGRSLTVHRLVLDELRQHHSYDAVAASVPATNAVPDAQVWALSNAGSDKSIVLNDWRRAAIEYIETGDGDERTAIMEWSAPADASPLDMHALAMANPNLGRRIDADSLMGDALTAVNTGGELLSTFKTENMCINEKVINPAINLAAWSASKEISDIGPELRNRVAMVIDTSLDSEHTTLYVAVVQLDGKVRVEPVHAWESTTDFGDELKAIVQKVKPRVFGWFPNGPAAALMAVIKGEDPWWAKAKIEVEELRGEVTAVCMGFAALIKDDGVRHSGDALLDDQITGTEKSNQGDAWRFTRRGAGHCDAVYAAAGAVHLARTMPPPKKRGPLVVVSHAHP